MGRNLWNYVDEGEMNDYVKSRKSIEMENWFCKAIINTIKFPVDIITTSIRKTRSGLYFNIYDNKKQIGHASFHYDENRPGSISHVVNDHDRIRDDVDIVHRKNKIIFMLVGKTYDLYGFFHTMAKGLTDSFYKLLRVYPDMKVDKKKYCS
jgi:hypothetical protein